MEEFINNIDSAKFRSTNAVWNSLMLNDPWSVGYVSTLIELQEWKTKEDWEAFYYQSGEERKKNISDFPIETRNIVENFELIRKDRSKVESLSWDVKNINKQYGRTQDDFLLKAKVLFDAVKNNGLNLTLEECYECIRFRVICETWNGIIIRENNTISNLSKLFPLFKFKKVSGEIDHKFAVDFEVYKDDKLVCAIQVKPESYLWNAPYISKARQANNAKNLSYSTLFNVPVWNVIADSKGNIKNSEIFENLKKVY